MNIKDNIYSIIAPDIAPDGEYPERESYSNVILNDRLKDALKRINPGMPDRALADAFRQIIIPQSPSLIMNNKSFQKMITDGIDVQVKQPDASYRTEKVYVKCSAMIIRRKQPLSLTVELIPLAKQINEAEKRGESTGLAPDELAFYDALADNESAREIMDDEILKQIARDLTQSIKSNISVDWAIRESVQAKMKMTIKRLLKKYGYPPDKTPKALEIVMEQTKLMCGNEAR